MGRTPNLSQEVIDPNASISTKRKCRRQRRSERALRICRLCGRKARRTKPTEPVLMEHSDTIANLNA
jgi:hypothetical protein